MKTIINYLTYTITLVTITSHVLVYAQSSVGGSPNSLPNNSSSGNVGNKDITKGSRHHNSDILDSTPIDPDRRDEINNRNARRPSKNEDYRAQLKIPANSDTNNIGTESDGPSHRR